MTSSIDEVDEAMAAFNLCYMKHFVHAATKQQKPRKPEEEERKLAVNSASSLPHVPSLHKLIGVCSKPYAKKLTMSDVKDDQARLAIGKNHARNHLIPMLNANESLQQGIRVVTYDKRGKEYPMVFKLWADKVHVLTGGWKTFCQEHELVDEQDIVKVWMFRNVVTDNLCFVVDRF